MMVPYPVIQTYRKCGETAEVYLALSEDSSSSPGRTKLKVEVLVSLKEKITSSRIMCLTDSY